MSKRRAYPAAWQPPADVNARDSDGLTALHRACIQPKDASFVQVLVDAGADVMQKTLSGLTPLLLMFTAATVDTVQLQQPVEQIWEYLNACEQIASILMTTDRRCVNEADNEGNTPLIHAVMMGSVSLVQLLLDQSADVTPLNKEKKTAFDIAFQSLPNPTFRMLIRSKSYKNCRQLRDPAAFGNLTVQCDRRKGDTLLHIACREGYTHLILQLLKAGVSTHLKNEAGLDAWTVYMTCGLSHLRMDEVFCVIKAFGPRLEPQRDFLANDVTACSLHYFCCHQLPHDDAYYGCLFLLLDQGCPVNRREFGGLMPFQHSLNEHCMSFPAMQLLISAGSRIGSHYTDEATKFNTAMGTITKISDLRSLRPLLGLTAGGKISQDKLRRFMGDDPECHDVILEFSSPLPLQTLVLQVVRQRCTPNAFVAAPKLLDIAPPLREVVPANYSMYRERYVDCVDRFYSAELGD